jgi:hypothetical protein
LDPQSRPALGGSTSFLQAKIAWGFSPVVTWAVVGAIYGSISYCLVAKPTTLPELLLGTIGFGLVWAVVTTVGLVGPWVKGGTVAPFVLGVIRVACMGAPAHMLSYRSGDAEIFWGFAVISGAMLPWSANRILRVILFVVALAATMAVGIMRILDGPYEALLARVVIGGVIGTVVGLLAGTIAWTADSFVSKRKQAGTKPRDVAPEVKSQRSKMDTRRSAMSFGRLAVVIALAAVAVICYLIFAAGPRPPAP